MLYIEREKSAEERGTPQSTKSIGSAKNVTIDNNPTPEKIGSILETRNWVGLGLEKKSSQAKRAGAY